MGNDREDKRSSRVYELSPHLSIDYLLPSNNVTYFLINVSRLVEEDRELLKEVEGWLKVAGEIDKGSEEWRAFVKKSIERIEREVKVLHT